MSNLSQILVNDVQYAQDTVLVPKSTGYPPTEVRFVRADGSLISPILPNGALHTIAPSGALMVPPCPDADRISCGIKSKKGSANIVLDLGWIWWRLENDCSDPGEWCAKPLVMTREEFREHAHANVKISLMSKRQAPVRAGFDDEPGQPYSRKAEEDRISIPLYHFVYHDQINRRLDADAHFNLEWAGQKMPLIRILADPMPEILSFIAESSTITAGEESILKWATRNSDDARVAIDPGVGEVEHAGSRSVRPSKTTTYTLTLAVSGTHNIRRSITVAVESSPGPDERAVPHVMSTGGGWRAGKGFSLREFNEAGLTVSEAADRSIPIDRRRRTSHRANVERIRSMLNV